MADSFSTPASSGRDLNMDVPPARPLAIPIDNAPDHNSDNSAPAPIETDTDYRRETADCISSTGSSTKERQDPEQMHKQQQLHQMFGPIEERLNKISSALATPAIPSDGNGGLSQRVQFLVVVGKHIGKELVKPGVIVTKQEALEYFEKHHLPALSATLPLEEGLWVQDVYKVTLGRKQGDTVKEE